MRGVVVEVREPGATARRVSVTRTVEVGRECDGLLIGDAAASRRHATLAPSTDGLTVTDLGSSNGTVVDGRRIDSPVTLHLGGSLRIGETVLEVVEVPLPRVAPRPVPVDPAEVSRPDSAVPSNQGDGRAAAPVAEPEEGPQAPTGRRTLSIPRALAERLDAEHRRLNYELGGVEKRRCVEAVIEAGLSDPERLAKLLRRA